MLLLQGKALEVAVACIVFIVAISALLEDLYAELQVLVALQEAALAVTCCQGLAMAACLVVTRPYRLATVLPAAVAHLR